MDTGNAGRALEFVRRFCAGDVAGLAPLLDPRLRFRGPLLACDSAAGYLAALRADPPAPCECRVIAVTESADEVAVFYEYPKPGGALTVAQLFRFSGGRIGGILTVFDARAAGAGSE